jgi:hypothetical protein
MGFSLMDSAGHENRIASVYPDAHYQTCRAFVERFAHRGRRTTQRRFQGFQLTDSSKWRMVGSLSCIKDRGRQKWLRQANFRAAA